MMRNLKLIYGVLGMALLVCVCGIAVACSGSDDDGKGDGGPVSGVITSFPADAVICLESTGKPVADGDLTLEQGISYKFYVGAMADGKAYDIDDVDWSVEPDNLPNVYLEKGSALLKVESSNGSTAVIRVIAKCQTETTEIYATDNNGKKLTLTVKVPYFDSGYSTSLYYYDEKDDPYNTKSYDSGSGSYDSGSGSYDSGSGSYDSGSDSYGSGASSSSAAKAGTTNRYAEW